MRGAVAALVALGALAALSVPVWRWAFARFEASGQLAALVERRPDKFRLQWRSVRSPWPGWVEVEGLVVTGRTPRLRWQVTADEVSGVLQPLALLRRQLHFHHLRARGLTVRSARFDPPPPIDARHGPPIAGLPATPGPGPRTDRPAWSYRFSGLEFRDLREVWTDDRRLTGAIHGSGGFALHRRTLCEIEPAQIEIDRLEFAVGDHAVASAVTGAARFRIAPWRYQRAPVERVAQSFSGQVDLSGQLEPERLLRALFGDRDWLHAQPAPAQFESDLRVAHGRLVAGSRLALVQPVQSLDLFGFAVTGDARLAATVSGRRPARLDSSLQLDHWRLGRPGAPPFLGGSGLRLEAQIDEPRLHNLPESLRLSLDLGTARADDLTFFAAYLPPTFQTRIVSGAAELSGRLEFDPGQGGGSGQLQVRAPDLQLEVGGQPIAGDVRARIQLAEPELHRPYRFSVAGSQIRLDGFSAPGVDGVRMNGWWSELDLRSGHVELDDSIRLSADFDAKLRDTRPLVFVWQLRRDLPSWAERLLTLEGLSASGRFDWSRGQFRLERGHVPLANGEIRAEARLEEAWRQARLLMTWRRLAVGLAIDGDQRDIRLIGARDWYAAQTTGESADGG